MAGRNASSEAGGRDSGLGARGSGLGTWDLAEALTRAAHAPWLRVIGPAVGAMLKAGYRMASPREPYDRQL